ncbi:MAG: hypothetical protein ABIW85_00625 [Variovorax sp.]
MKTHLVAAAALALCSTGYLAAQTTNKSAPASSANAPAVVHAPVAPAASGATTPMHSAATGATTSTRHDGGAAFAGEKDRLEKMLQSGQSRGDYANMLEKAGYRISAINADKKDYLEYEVVKADHSYEVQLDFKDGAAKATKIDVTSNMWRAASTKAMLRDNNYKHATPLVADAEGRYSDRRYMKGWSDEKDTLEKMLKPNMKASDYADKLKQAGYKITSVNDRESDYLEYEIVKGNNSYEVQIDMDPKTKLAKKVDVATNVWETDATERAKAKN